MEHEINEVEVFETEEKISHEVMFEVIDSELLAINKPTVQLYGN